MKKRIISLLLAVLILLPMLPAKTAEAAFRSGTPSYLRKGDYIVISPAEKWENGQRVAVTTTEWELTAQSSGVINGNDIQTWKYGVSDKFCINDQQTVSGIPYVRIQCKNFRESGGGRYWDIENRSKKAGGNLHVWTYKDADSQWFYLEEDGDGDGETFFIKNKNSNLYLVPENYFKDLGNDCGMKRNSWSEEGCNVKQSNYAFRWRIQVLNRDAVTDMGGVDKYANWMNLLPDNVYLSSLNIPGTHDSGTTNVEGSWNSSFNVVACQKYFIEQQLYAGIRSLDIRTQWNKDSKDMVLVHGSATFVCHTPDHGNSTNKRLRDVLNTVISFLQSHPGETVIMTLKIDGGSNAETVETLGQVLLDFLDSGYSRYFYQWAGIPEEQSEKDAKAAIEQMRQGFTSPLLGAARGKIVLLSRVDFGSFSIGDNKNPAISLAQWQKLCAYTGPNLSQWDSKYNDDLHYAQPVTSGSGVTVWVQDDYECTDSNKKTQVMNTILQLNGNLSGYDYLRTPAAQEFVFNYTSKTTSSSLGASPLGGAKYMNNLIYNDAVFTPNTKEATANPRLGIVVMDYVNKQLCRRIIDRNTFPSSAGMVTAASSARSAWPPFQYSMRSLSMEPMDMQWEENEPEINDPVYGDPVTDIPDDPDDGVVDIDTPSDDTPDVDAPNDGTPDIDTPNDNTQDVDTPNDGAPDIDIPDIDVPDYILEIQEEIIWPESAELTYGYVLGEATLNFYTNEALGRAGSFQFVQPDQLLEATEIETDGRFIDYPVYQTLLFFPADGSPAEARSIPVTVHKRPLPIKIGYYDVEYGDTFSRADITVTAGGYLLEKDNIKVPQIIESNDIHWVLRYDSSDEEIERPGVPSTDALVSGTIWLRADNVEEGERVVVPNYVYTVEMGGWAVVPRTVTVNWNYSGGRWNASLGNILPGDEVYPVVDSEGMLTLAGSEADYYRVADADHTQPDDIPVQPSNPSENPSWPAFTPSTPSTQEPEKEPEKAPEKEPEKGPEQKPVVENRVMPFTDIPAAHYAKDAIQWAWENNYFSGVSDTSFAPEQELNRAMLVTVLWRMADTPAGSYYGFTDVVSGSWYEQAVAWAASRGVVYGTADGVFSPDMPITREQLVTILWRYAGSPKSVGDLSAFSDVPQISPYAADAMNWAVESGILAGLDGQLLPQSGATRAQTALVLQRFSGLV